MSELPKGWVEVEWNQITATDGFRRGPFGGNLKKDCFVDDGYAVYEQYAPINDDCNNFRYFITEDKYNELSGFHVENGDFLISCSGTMGKITHVPKGAPKGVINQALLRIRLQDNFVQPEYFLRLFRSPTLQGKVLNKVVGGAIQNLAAVAELKKIKLPVAPINEQIRIVEKLDEVLAQVDTIKARLDGIPAILKRFRQSVLAAAVSGRLTEEWRRDNKQLLLSEDCYLKEINHHFNNKKKVDQKRVSNIKEQDWFYNPNNLPEGWVTSFLIDITHVITCGVAKKPEYTETGVRFLSAQNSKPFSPNLNGIRYISENDYKTFTVGAKPEKGDVLYSRVGANFGEACVIPWDFDFAIYVSLTLLKPIKELVTGEYLTLFLNSQDGILQSRGGIMGSGIQNLNVESVRKYKLGLPSLAEQKEIVRLVDQYFAFADTIEAQVKKAQTRVNNLTQSILAKAFRGELVAQDPNDEPAEKLLERIAQARKEAEALAKVTKKVAKTK